MSKGRRWLETEVRTSEDGKVLVGRCVVYNSWSEPIMGRFREQIVPGAFDECLQRGVDVYCSVDHDMKRFLGRVSAGTLKLTRDDKGIGVECPLQGYSYEQDLLLDLKSGNLRGMSFIFDVTQDRWETRDGTPHRTVLKAEMFEVSFVHFPAYPTTEAGVRMAFPAEQDVVTIAESWNRTLRARQRLRVLEASI